MSRKRTTKDSIRNRENYFNSFIALEIKREKHKQFEIHDMELSIEEHVLDISITYQCAVNKAQEDFERVTLGDERLSWIETIKDERLYNAIQQLSEQQKLILVMYFHEGLSMERIADTLHCTKMNISKRLAKIYEQIIKCYR